MTTSFDRDFLHDLKKKISFQFIHYLLKGVNKQGHSKAGAKSVLQADAGFALLSPLTNRRGAVSQEDELKAV